MERTILDDVEEAPSMPAGMDESRRDDPSVFNRKQRHFSKKKEGKNVSSGTHLTLSHEPLEVFLEDVDMVLFMKISGIFCTSKLKSVGLDLNIVILITLWF